MLTVRNFEAEIFTKENSGGDDSGGCVCVVVVMAVVD